MSKKKNDDFDLSVKDEVNENIDNIKTEYEERFMEKGIKINRVEVRK